MMYLQSSARRPFSDWLADVDRILLKRVGVEAHSIDYPWSSEYKVGTSPKEAVDEWQAANNGRRAQVWL